MDKQQHKQEMDSCDLSVKTLVERKLGRCLQVPQAGSVEDEPCKDEPSAVLPRIPEK